MTVTQNPAPIGRDGLDVLAEQGGSSLQLRRFLMTYRFGLEEVLTRVTILRDEMRTMHGQSPIEHMESASRVQRASW